MTKEKERAARHQRVAHLFVGILLLGSGFMLGQHYPGEKPCVTADCIRDRYGYSASLSVEEGYRSRWITTNATSLHAMQFTRGGFHISYIDNEYPYMYSIDFANNTPKGHIIRVSVSDTNCMDDHRNDRDYFGCSDVYEGTLNLTPPYIPQPQYEPVDTQPHGACRQHGYVTTNRIRLYNNVTCNITCNNGTKETTFLLKTDSKEETMYALIPQATYGPDMQHCTTNCTGIFRGWSCNEATS